jgi:DNA topoisomerase-3
MLKLYITEKPNAAKDLANALGFHEKNEDGFYYGEIIQPQEVEGIKIVIGYAAGHFITLKEPADMDERYEKWNIADLPILYGEDDYLKIIKGKEKGFHKLEKYIRKADVIINAGDAGREGELIQRWIQKMAGGHDHVYRLWASSLTKEALIKADKEVTPQNKYNALYAAGEARVLMDATIGFNYSRAISLTKTDGVTVTYGRCQSPLLQAIISRDQEVESFVPVPFSYIKAAFHYEDEIFDGVMVDEKQQRVEYDGEESARKVLDQISEDAAKVLTIEDDVKVQRPPKPYDLLNLQKEMARRFGYDADKTLEICQALYDTHKILSYPRTDSEYLTSDLKGEVKKHLSGCCFGPFTSLVKKAGQQIPDRYFNDKKVADHHALLPIGGKEMEKKYYQLSEEEKNVFDFVCRRFIALFYPEHIFSQVKIVSQINSFFFLSKGRKEKQLGFKQVYQGLKEAGEQEEENRSLPDLNPDDIVSVTSKEVVNDQTKPKKRYTTDSLLTMMKMYNIGTGATRAGLIKELTLPKGKNRDCYVKKKGNSYISTPFGREIASLIPEELKSLNLLADFDGKLREIEDGKLGKDIFMEQLHADLRQRIAKMAEETNVLMKASRPEHEATTLICPRCGKKLIAYEKGYGCSGYHEEQCKFFIGNRYKGKKLSEATIRKLLTEGHSNKLKGFTSKAGKKFDASLIYKGEKIMFSFMDK